MLKFSSKLPLIGLALGGIVASSLPWIEVVYLRGICRTQFFMVFRSTASIVQSLL